MLRAGPNEDPLRLSRTRGATDSFLKVRPLHRQFRLLELPGVGNGSGQRRGVGRSDPGHQSSATHPACGRPHRNRGRPEIKIPRFALWKSRPTSHRTYSRQVGGAEPGLERSTQKTQRCTLTAVLFGVRPVLSALPANPRFPESSRRYGTLQALPKTLAPANPKLIGRDSVACSRACCPNGMAVAQTTS